MTASPQTLVESKNVCTRNEKKCVGLIDCAAQLKQTMKTTAKQLKDHLLI